MSKTNIVIAVLGFILFFALIIGAIRYQMISEDALRLLHDSGAVEKVEMTIMISPNFDEVKKVAISERSLLDSLSTALKYHNKPIRITIAKDNDVHVMLTVYKRKSKASLEVFDSKYTGWVLKVGSNNFTNDYVFRFVQRYL